MPMSQAHSEARFSVLVASFMSLAVLAFYGVFGDSFRQAIYFLPLLILLTFMVSNSILYSKFGILVFLLYQLAFLGSVYINDVAFTDFYAARDYAIFSIIFFLLAFSTRISERHMILFLLVTFVFIVARGLFGMDEGGLGISVQASYSPFESVFSGVYACAALIFLKERRLFYAGVFAIASLVAFKRNAWLAGFACVIFIYVFHVATRHLQSTARRRALLFFSVIVFLFSIAVSIFSSAILELSRDILMPRATMGQFTMGRAEIYRIIDERIGEAGPFQLFFGFGPGSVKALLEAYTGNGLPHSEIRHFMYDYGYVGVVLLFASFICMVRSTENGFIIAWFSALSGIIDNFYFVYLISIPCIMLSHTVMSKTGGGRG